MLTLEKYQNLGKVSPYKQYFDICYPTAKYSSHSVLFLIFGVIMSFSIQPRHIQEADSNSTLVPHWGYASRVLPCTNDVGSCEYLDAIYWMHDTSMLYTFVLWAVIGFVFLTAIALRLFKPVLTAPKTLGSESKTLPASSSYYRAWRGIGGTLSKKLLPESFVGFFGHVTRLQLLLLAILFGYLLIFS